ncbi:transposase [Enterococcus casseliflavus]|nr:transposase [Enterococcus casseliflavus]MBF0015404.1 transposase [Enterococcus casseliflavus]
MIEGANISIQVIKRIAYSYQNSNNFREIIYLI